MDGVLDLVGVLLWVPAALLRLWRWLTEERALPHQLQSKAPEMETVRWVARLALGFWLAASAVAAANWFDAWGDTLTTFLIGVAAFTAGPVLLVALTGWWRDHIVARLSR